MKTEGICKSQGEKKKKRKKYNFTCKIKGYRSRQSSGVVVVIQRSTDWIGMRIPPNECIFDAFICKNWFDKSSIYLVD